MGYWSCLGCFIGVAFPYVLRLELSVTWIACNCQGVMVTKCYGLRDPLRFEAVTGVFAGAVGKSSAANVGAKFAAAYVSRHLLPGSTGAKMQRTRHSQEVTRRANQFSNEL